MTRAAARGPALAETVIAVGAFLVALGLLGGCSDSSPSSSPQEVVVYTSVDELFSRPIAERFEDETCIANPLFGTTSMHAAALFAVLGEDEARQFFEGFVANGGRILSSNGEVRRRVARGECAVGITDSDDYNVARIEGKPVGVVFPDSAGMGTLVIPNAALRIAGGPNTEPAEQFINFLLTPEIEQALAESEAAQMPLRPGVPIPDGVRSLESITPMRVDYMELALILERISRSYLKEWVDRNLQ